SASSPTGTVMEWTARPRQMKQGSLLLIGLGYPVPGSSGRFGRPAPRFHTHPVESGFLLGVGAGADNHGISTGAPRHPRLLHTGGAVPPEVSHVRASLAVAGGGPVQPASSAAPRTRAMNPVMGAPLAAEPGAVRPPHR